MASHLNILKSSAALAAIWITAPANAQINDTSRAPQSVETAEADEESAIVVTATRTNRTGYTAPTPTTILSLEHMNQAQPASLADFVNQLPALSGSVSPRNNNGTTNGGTAGANLLNLRNLGVNRTLALLDGRRVVASTLTGAVDVNLLPTALIKRVDVVTGGASAAWGSDAVAGVVNFVLDDRYQGLKGKISKGITQEGDGSTFQAELSGGMAFADGRGHIVVSGQYSDSGRARAQDRGWYSGSKLILNPGYTPANGAPQYMVARNVGLASATDNGLITAGPLRGTQFGPDGLALPTLFDFGYVAGLQSLGGSGEDQGGRIEISIPTKNYSAFGHVSYELTDAVEIFGEVGYGRSEADYLSVSYNRFGNLALSADNAYLDPAVRNALVAAGETGFRYGSSNIKFGQLAARNTREMERYLAGFKADVGGWNFNGYYQHGVSRIVSEVGNNPIAARYEKAANGVKLANGAIVCAVNADAVASNDDPACSPLNPFGAVPASDQARAYVFGTARQAIDIKQDVVAGTVAGEPVSTWAGPISIVIGAEYRRETFKATADAVSIANGFFTGNFKPSSGRISVKEMFGEVVVPLLKDVPFAQDVSFNGALRYTDYSMSGSVTTWKAGLTWEASREWRLRGVLSRDIRAPNLNDLFQGGQAFPLAVADPVANSSYATFVTVVGNRNLRPERADTLSVGIGYKPDWLPGLALSADYYDIKIKQAIVSLAAQNLIDGCYGTSPSLCQYISRSTTTNLITEVLTPGINFSRERTTGLDFEVNYRTSLGAGTFDISALANHVRRRTIDTGFRVYEYAGTMSENTAVPKWRGLVNASYRQGGTTLNLRERFIGAGKYTKEITVKDNHVKAAYYTDVTLSHEFQDVAGKPSLFLAIDNVFNQSPRVSPLILGPVHINVGTNGSLYDVLGRAFRVGFRFDL
ncbi:TonB-dependent receptor [Rhizorhabdus wittichii]|uniref:TonB-dependent receptor n=1 Tax=Rhizorhabdus wittichii TaxID=160791 RepID=A0A975CZK7_9SPHN|nr:MULTISPECIES: TonB-dependent receptor [Sphingomonadaceae]QTH20222.1 TonB-dependent receptor [Rhizorhabdus wittichii]